MKPFLTILLASLLVLEASGQVASNLVSNFSAFAQRNDYSGTVGMEFVPEANYILSAIGYSNIVGSVQTHRVGIWLASNSNLVASVIIPAGGGYQTAAISPAVWLTNGAAYYMGAQQFAGGDFFYTDQSSFTANGVNVAGSFNTGVSGNQGFAVPANIAQSGNHMYGYLDFVFTNAGDIVYNNTFTASNGSWADLNYFETNVMQRGDTLIDPPGTNTFTNTLVILTGTTLQGSGSNATTMVDGTVNTNNGTPVISAITVNNALTRVSGIHFAAGLNVNPTNAANGTEGIGTVSIGGNYFFRVDSCQFDDSVEKWITTFGIGLNGVIDHCTFVGSTPSAQIKVEESDLGMHSWGTPSTWGSTNAVVFEDDTFLLGTNAAGYVDTSDGARLVVRHCTIIGTGQHGVTASTHDTGRGGPSRSVRYIDFYSNTVLHVYSSTFPNDQGQGFVGFYGGSGHVFSNFGSNILGVASILPLRPSDNSTNYAPWFGATGTGNSGSGWDSNSPTLFLTVTAAVTSVNGYGSYTTNILTVTTTNLMPHAWQGYTLIDPLTAITNSTPFTNEGNIMVVTDNGTNWFTGFTGVHDPSCYLQVTNGHIFYLHKVLAAIDTIGAGQCSVLTFNENGTPFWVTNQYEPLWFGGSGANSNVVYGNVAGNPVLQPTVIGTQLPGMIVEGINFSNAFDPNYTPLSYPHPLTLLSTNSPPVISGQPQSASAPAGGSASFSVTASGTAPLAYQWFTPGLNAGQTNSTYNTGTLTTPGTDSIFVVVANGSGSVTSSVITLTVTNGAPQIVSQPQSTTNGIGSTATFSVAVAGVPAFTYQWFALSAIAGATAASYTTPTLAASGTTPFSVVVANAYGSATSSVATLTVTNLTPPPSIPTNQWYAVTNYLNGNAVSTNYYFNP